MTDGENRPWSEFYRLAGEEWADLDAAATLLEDTKSSLLAQRALALGDLAVNKSEQIVKASPEWRDHLASIVEARRKANVARVQMDAMRMRFQEWSNAEANRRTEARL